jgi:hypothetical protein
LKKELGVLASIEDFPVWARERLGERSLYTFGIDLPACFPDGFFYQFFQRTRWFAVLPLLIFLRECLPAPYWLKADARASIIIDDPNLHRTKYGFIDFANLVRHADQHNYHASIATIPLDMWYTNLSAANTFRDNPKRLSLLLHGVNHTSNELAQECSAEEASVTLAKGLGRVERFERKSGLSVARVIAAPHGAFREHFASAMSLFEFEGACVSLGSLLKWNPQRNWPADTGSSFVQAMGIGSLPVFHRIGRSDIEIRLLSFLGHPLIVATHHQDCAMSYSEFERLASTINGISRTNWCSIQEIARSNYCAQQLGSTLQVFLYSRHISLRLPPGIRGLEFKSTPFCARDIPISLDMLEGKREQVVVDNLALRWDAVSNQLLVRSIVPLTLSHGEMSLPPGQWWPFLRRLLTEARDRTLPLIPSWWQSSYICQ